MRFAIVTLISIACSLPGSAQNGPTMLAPNLGVRTVVSGLAAPTTMAFIGPDEFLVLEKGSGEVKHVLHGAVTGVAIDLSVNNASERGLLGIALDPNFEANGFVYLYWTCQSEPPPAPAIFPTETTCPDPPATGADTNNVLAVPLLGNRVDRFIWDGSTLKFDLNLIRLRVFQNDGVPVPPDQGDEGQNPAGNHDGGIITFGPDGKLYIVIGDNGRRGQLQNLPSGPTETGLGPTVPDDQFGGPEPDNAHFTGVIIRLNPDGSTPIDNPFFQFGASVGGEVGSNIQRIFAYGIRNSFGMAFDPHSGNLWMAENGDDTFDELNLVFPGFNSGWIQTMGPASRVGEFKGIETSMEFFGLQQQRWPPTRLADTTAEALTRMFMLPGAQFSDPELSWRFAIAPSAIGFLDSGGLGPQYYGDLFMGLSRTFAAGGGLFHFNLTGNRTKIPGPEVIENFEKHDLTGSESYLIGRDFGIITDIETAPNGNLWIVSLSNGAVYEVFSTRAGAKPTLAR